jgi:hypothetical protein
MRVENQRDSFLQIQAMGAYLYSEALDFPLTTGNSIYALAQRFTSNDDNSKSPKLYESSHRLTGKLGVAFHSIERDFRLTVGIELIDVPTLNQ